MIYQKRRELDEFSSTDRHLTYGGDNIGIIKTTEVSVPAEAMTPNAIHLQPMSRQATDPSDPNTNGIYLVIFQLMATLETLPMKGFLLSGNRLELAWRFLSDVLVVTRLNDGTDS